MKTIQNILTWAGTILIILTAYAAFGLRNGILAASGFIAAGVVNFVLRTHFTTPVLMGVWILCACLGLRTFSFAVLALLVGVSVVQLLRFQELKKACAAAGKDRAAVRRALWNEDVSVRLWRGVTRRTSTGQQPPP